MGWLREHLGSAMVDLMKKAVDEPALFLSLNGTAHFLNCQLL
jgi:hypothetical protein